MPHRRCSTLGRVGYCCVSGGLFAAPTLRISRVMAPASAARKRALAFGYTGEHFTLEEWLALLEFYGHRCLRCGSREGIITVDHVIPLSLGGANTIDNIQPLCEGCNLLKGQGTTDYRPSHTREGVQMA